jgi:hypothetical protein
MAGKLLSTEVQRCLAELSAFPVEETLVSLPPSCCT